MSELEKLEKKYGKDTVERMFTEYWMLTVSKSMKYDEIVEAINGKGCTLDHIKEILYDEGEDN